MGKGCGVGRESWRLRARAKNSEAAGRAQQRLGNSHRSQSRRSRLKMCCVCYRLQPVVIRNLLELSLGLVVRGEHA
jgi:hypothetical protein